MDASDLMDGYRSFLDVVLSDNQPINVHAEQPCLPGAIG
jgi:hypothetical protein